MEDEFKPSEWPRPYPSKNVPIYEPPPESNMPFLVSDDVGFSYTPVDTLPITSPGPIPDMLDEVDYPESGHPKIRKPAYYSITNKYVY